MQSYLVLEIIAESPDISATYNIWQMSPTTAADSFYLIVEPEKMKHIS